MPLKNSKNQSTYFPTPRGTKSKKNQKKTPKNQKKKNRLEPKVSRPKHQVVTGNKTYFSSTAVFSIDTIFLHVVCFFFFRL